VEELKLDELVPAGIHDMIAVNEKNGYNFRNRFDRGPVGFEPKKLLGWRQLERRSHEIGMQFTKHSDAFWRGLRDMWTECKASGIKQLCFVDDAGVTARVYSDGGMSVVNVKEIIDQSIKNPNLKSFTASTDVSREFYRQLARNAALRKRYNTYYRAFQYAIRLRLDTYVEEKLLVTDQSRWSYCTPTCFHIENEGRHYLVNSDDHGKLIWIDSVMIKCT